ncbi:PilW family protein [Desulfocicer niacini]
MGKYLKNNIGFTLIELLVAMAISIIVAAGIFIAYKSQQDAQLAQKQIVEMQQNLRAALYIMTRDIRMAGYDPDGGKNAGITKIGNGTDGNPLGFTFWDDDAGTLETIEYDLYDAYDDGDMDIGRKIGSANRQAIAENINTLQFVYFKADGSVATTISDVRSIQISIGATINFGAVDHTLGNNRMLTTIVKCRNLGL